MSTTIDYDTPEVMRDAMYTLLGGTKAQYGGDYALSIALQAGDYLRLTFTAGPKFWCIITDTLLTGDVGQSWDKGTNHLWYLGATYGIEVYELTGGGWLFDSKMNDDWLLILDTASWHYGIATFFGNGSTNTSGASFAIWSYDDAYGAWKQTLWYADVPEYMWMLDSNGDILYRENAIFGGDSSSLIMFTQGNDSWYGSVRQIYGGYLILADYDEDMRLAIKL